MGHVYVVEDENNRVKIGRSINPEARISSIKTGAGVKLKRTFITIDLENYGKIETEALRMFRHKDNIGEWVSGGYDEVVSFVLSVVGEKGKKKLKKLKFDGCSAMAKHIRDNNDNIVSDMDRMFLVEKAKILLLANDVMMDLCTDLCTEKEAIRRLYKIINEFAYSNGESELQEIINELKSLDLSAIERSKIKWKSG